MDKIVEQIGKLEEAYTQKTLMDIDYMEKRKEIESIIADQLRDLDAEYNPIKDAISEKISEMEENIKKQVLQAEQSVKGMQLQFVYNKGRVSWDTKALDGYAAGHPEIAQFRKVGDPSVTLRKG